MSVEQTALRRFLQAQRDSVAAVVDGLDDERGARVVVPSGWSPAQMVDHLRGAERYWLGAVVAGQAPGGRPASPARSVPEAVAAYAEQWRASDAVIDATALDQPVRGPVPDDLADDVPDLRGVLLHLIEETARHAGHLDVARELIDGRVGLGPR